MNFWLSTSVWAVCYLAREQYASGNLHLARQTYQQALKLISESDEIPPAAGLAHLGLGQLACEWNDLSGAARSLEKALEIFSQKIQVATLFETYIALAIVNQAVGNNPAVFLEKARQVATPDLRAEWAAWHVFIALQQHDFTVGTRWFDTCDIANASPLETLMCIKMLLIRGEADEALELIENTLANENCTMLYKLKLMVLQAETFHVFGETAQAVSILSHVLEITEEEGFIRLFLDAGALLTDLLKGILTTRPPVSALYAGKLLQAMDRTAAPLPVPANNIIIPLSDPLTEREMEVLHYLIAGYSNRDIAQILVVSEGTVKTHIKSIYSKMNVHSRTQAAARARALGLFL